METIFSGGEKPENEQKPGRLRLLKRRQGSRSTPKASWVLDAIPDPVIVVDENDQICYANAQAQQFFQSSAAHLGVQSLTDILPFGSPVFGLVGQVRTAGASVKEYSVDLSTPHIGRRVADVHVSAIAEQPDLVLIVLKEGSIARQMDQQLTHRSAARSVTGMACMLAHEIKNPLSGIRGAAQLVEQNASETDKVLTQLICAEADRICKLVDRVEAFSDQRPLKRKPLNIHQVLEHVRRVADAGFARNLRITEAYDPSLPDVMGDRDQLIQVFLNLVKNAAEALDGMNGAEITISTAYRHGVRLAVPGGRDRLSLPLEVCIKDNGPGIPEDIKAHMFDPFVSTKPNGTGLGLSLVAKIIGDHGGVITCESEPRHTVFRILLPIRTKTSARLQEDHVPN
ncbi:MAG TPA: two-component sensor histidine kinase [Alphaproteobacteria bacterium]|jgi:two-component system nitrogen regulation sensor histidine kinase GlnL|nr:two-component sensor histidine kinase [Alphaproteobacteria bacterium]HBG51104.1 two-component sensor histidine kinase [Gammaproteobacteria bacterium]HAM46645.1 two-component sensor histidine kinase [Alphaproteobacteria bacterium]HBA43714.1 two-component sensor histidine kinase [Alphaproteobacteria bacterium]HBC54475.1 two-component sensor histidine kinase [Alphaproteobacteria bacterium]